MSAGVGVAGSVSGPQAFAAAESRSRSKDWYRRCQEFVRTALGIGPGAGSATEAYQQNATRGTIHTDRNPPPNVPVFWDTGNPDGHVALSAGGGQVWSTDIERHGQIDEVPLSEIESKWGAHYLGWGTYVNGQNLNVDPAMLGTGMGAGMSGLAAGATVQDAAFNFPGPFDDYLKNKAKDTAKDAVKSSFDLAVEAVNDTIIKPLGNFFIKAGFVGLGFGLVAIGAVRISQSPSPAGQAVAGAGKAAKATGHVATAPVRKVKAVKSTARAGAAGVASKGAVTTDPLATPPKKPAGAAPATAPGTAPATAAPKPRPAAADKPPF